MGTPISISPIDLYAVIGTASAPALLDVRRTASFDANEGLIISALRRDPERMTEWHRGVPRNRLRALSLGLSANFLNEHEMLEHGMIMYDALYTWCRCCQGETHNWTPEVRA